MRAGEWEEQEVEVTTRKVSGGKHQVRKRQVVEISGGRSYRCVGQANS